MADSLMERRNYWVMLAQGVFVDFANSVSSPKMVLPFIYIAAGAPVFLAGILLPMVQVSKIFGQIGAAPLVSNAHQRKYYCTISLFGVAFALGLIAVSANVHQDATLIFVFVLASIIIGTFQGMSRIAIQQLLGDLLTKEHRSNVLFAYIAIGAGLTIAVAWATLHILTHENPLQDHVILLWAGVLGCIASAITILFLREPRHEKPPVEYSPQKTRSGRTIGLAVNEFKEAAKQTWFRRMIVAWVMMLSVEFAMPFYAIHAAMLHAEETNSLSLFVIAASLGVILGAPLWRFVSRYSIKQVMVGCCLVACAAAGYAIAVTVTPSIHDRTHYAVVIFGIAAATRGLTVARTLYLIQAVPGDNRPYFEAAARSVTGTLAIPFSIALGALAHLHSEVGSILVLGTLNALTILTIFALRDEDKVRAQALSFSQQPTQ